MKAKELIELLQNVVDEHGDKEITVLIDGSTTGTTGSVYPDILEEIGRAHV